MINDNILNEQSADALPPFLSSGALDVIYDFLLITFCPSLAYTAHGKAVHWQEGGSRLKASRELPGNFVFRFFNVYLPPSSRQFQMINWLLEQKTS